MADDARSPLPLFRVMLLLTPGLGCLALNIPSPALWLLGSPSQRSGLQRMADGMQGILFALSLLMPLLALAWGQPHLVRRCAWLTILSMLAMLVLPAIFY